MDLETLLLKAKEDLKKMESQIEKHRSEIKSFQKRMNATREQILKLKRRSNSLAFTIGYIVGYGQDDDFEPGLIVGETQESYLGMDLIDAAVEVLRKKGEAMQASEITDAVFKGGFQHETTDRKSYVYVSLRRAALKGLEHGSIQKVIKRGREFGLPGWGPERYSRTVRSRVTRKSKIPRARLDRVRVEPDKSS